MINDFAPLPAFLVNRYKKWKSTTFLNYENHFKKLATIGQNPSTMVISCCDSRVHVTSIFGADEGDFFIHRNIANLVPPYNPDGEHHGTSAAIEYATKELNIRHIIVLGHSDCGGIQSGYNLYSDKPSHSYEFINKWLSILKPAFNNISKNNSVKYQIKELEEEAIKHSIKNLISFPDINKKVKNKSLSIHGLIHDIKSGNLRYLNPLTKEFKKL